jgi:enoyl-CoA hydratase/carnithine racemase
MNISSGGDGTGGDEMTYDTLSIEHDGRITRIWLNRPERRNALNAHALEEIAAAFTAMQQRFEVSVIIFGGRGAAFCAGADRKDPPARIARGSGASARERRYTTQVGRRALEAIERSAHRGRRCVLPHPRG